MSNVVIERALQEIYDSNDKLTADLVVSTAQDPSSPLHPYFEWDDNVAAHQWRLNQARGLIARVKIFHEDRPAVRAWVNVPSLSSYQPAETVASDSDLLAEVLAGFLRDISRMRDRLRRFSEFADIANALDAIVAANGGDAAA